MADVAIQGLSELKSALRELEGKVPKELAAGMKAIALEIVPKVQAKMPFRLGNARKAVKASGTQRGASIKIGGDKALYGPWLDFGGAVGRRKSIKRPFIQTGRYLYPTIAEEHGATIKAVDKLVEELATRAGFTQRGEI